MGWSFKSYDLSVWAKQGEPGLVCRPDREDVSFDGWLAEHDAQGWELHTLVPRGDAQTSVLIVFRRPRS